MFKNFLIYTLDSAKENAQIRKLYKNEQGKISDCLSSRLNCVISNYVVNDTKEINFIESAITNGIPIVSRHYILCCLIERRILRMNTFRILPILIKNVSQKEELRISMEERTRKNYLSFVSFRTKPARSNDQIGDVSRIMFTSNIGKFVYDSTLVLGKKVFLGDPESIKNELIVDLCYGDSFLPVKHIFKRKEKKPYPPPIKVLEIHRIDEMSVTVRYFIRPKYIRKAAKNRKRYRLVFAYCSNNNVEAIQNKFVLYTPEFLIFLVRTYFNQVKKLDINFKSFLILQTSSEHFSRRIDIVDTYATVVKNKLKLQKYVVKKNEPVILPPPPPPNPNLTIEDFSLPPKKRRKRDTQKNLKKSILTIEKKNEKYPNIHSISSDNKNNRNFNVNYPSVIPISRNTNFSKFQNNNNNNNINKIANLVPSINPQQIPVPIAGNFPHHHNIELDIPGTVNMNMNPLNAVVSLSQNQNPLILINQQQQQQQQQHMNFQQVQNISNVVYPHPSNLPPDLLPPVETFGDWDGKPFHVNSKGIKFYFAVVMRKDKVKYKLNDFVYVDLKNSTTEVFSHSELVEKFNEEEKPRRSQEALSPISNSSIPSPGTPIKQQQQQPLQQTLNFLPKPPPPLPQKKKKTTVLPSIHKSTGLQYTDNYWICQITKLLELPNKQPWEHKMMFVGRWLYRFQDLVDLGFEELLVGHRQEFGFSRVLENREVFVSEDHHMDNLSCIQQRCTVNYREYSTIGKFSLFSPHQYFYYFKFNRDFVMQKCRAIDAIMSNQLQFMQPFNSKSFEKGILERIKVEDPSRKSFVSETNNIEGLSKFSFDTSFRIKKINREKEEEKGNVLVSRIPGETNDLRNNMKNIKDVDDLETNESLSSLDFLSRPRFGNTSDTTDMVSLGYSQGMKGFGKSKVSMKGEISFENCVTPPRKKAEDKIVRSPSNFNENTVERGTANFEKKIEENALNVSGNDIEAKIGKKRNFEEMSSDQDTSNKIKESGEPVSKKRKVK